MNFIVLDLEATCWQGNDMNRRQEIIELAAYRVNGYREWIDDFHSFIRPIDHPRLSSYCIELTGIPQEKVSKARKFGPVFTDFLDWIEQLDQPHIICTWGARDLEIIRDECLVHELTEHILPPFINLKAQYANMHRLPREAGLIKALEYSEIEFEGSHHRARDDAFNTTRLFLQYLDQWEY